MADEKKKDDKATEKAPVAAPAAADPRDAELASLRAELAKTRESEKNAIAYSDELEASLKEAEAKLDKVDSGGESPVGGSMREFAQVLGQELAKALHPDRVNKANLRKNQPLAEEFKGTKTYIVGASKHYRNGKMYQKGEKITVTNERPARDWKLFDPNGPSAEAQADAPTAPAGRANDKPVG